VRCEPLPHALHLGLSESRLDVMSDKKYLRWLRKDAQVAAKEASRLAGKSDGKVLTHTLAKAAERGHGMSEC
jgi:hypothetical protein